MNIQHLENEKRFAAYDESGEKIGAIEYVFAGDDLRATHTNVYKGNEGKGIAGLLLDALSCWAEERGSKIIPACRYVRAAFEKYPDKYAAVIK